MRVAEWTPLSASYQFRLGAELVQARFVVKDRRPHVLLLGDGGRWAVRMDDVVDEGLSISERVLFIGGSADDRLLVAGGANVYELREGGYSELRWRLERLDDEMLYIAVLDLGDRCVLVADLSVLIVDADLKEVALFGKDLLDGPLDRNGHPSGTSGELPASEYAPQGDVLRFGNPDGEVTFAVNVRTGEISRQPAGGFGG